MTERTYLNDAYDALKAGAEAIREIQDDIKILDEKINSGIYNANLQRKFLADRDSLRKDIEAAKKKCLDDGAAPFNREVSRLKRLDAVKGSDLSTDAALLNSGLRLTKRDLENLLEKPENQNPTMQRLFSEYISKHKIVDPETGNQWRIAAKNHAEEIRNVERERDAVRLYFGRWADQPNALDFLDKIMPEQAAYAHMEVE